VMQLRTASASDVATVAHILISSRREYLSFAKSPHSSEETHHWIRNTLIPTGSVVVAQLDDEDVGVLATSVTDGIGWIARAKSFTQTNSSVDISGKS